jgi:urease accessory protein UreF
MTVHVAESETPRMPLPVWPLASIAAVAASIEDVPSTSSSLRAWLATALEVPVARADSPSETLQAAVRQAPDSDTVESEAESESTPSPEASSGSSGSAPTDPMRVYAEWNEDGVRVWLGADADRLADISRIARALRNQLKQQGVRLYSLVCNGTDISLHDAVAAAPVESSLSIDLPRS